MIKETIKDGWVYIYDTSKKYRETYDTELTDVRYVLGERLDASKPNVLICIGINPSTAMPNLLDPTLKRVRAYAIKRGEYGAWYMLNIYPQRATDPDKMDTDDKYKMEIHMHNLAAIKNLLSTIENADVWCAWGAIINDTKRKFLSDLLFGNESKNITGIISLFDGKYHFKAHGATVNGHPKHPLSTGKDTYLKDLVDVGLKELSDTINHHIQK